MSEMQRLIKSLRCNDGRQAACQLQGWSNRSFRDTRRPVKERTPPRILQLRLFDIRIRSSSIAAWIEQVFQPLWRAAVIEFELLDRGTQDFKL